MNWIEITTQSQIEEIAKSTEFSIIFKHSTRCSISSMALNRLEKSWDDSKIKVNTYFLDLLAHRNLSDYIADKFFVYHQSPQVLLIKNGECTYEETHMGIRFDELAEQAN